MGYKRYINDVSNYYTSHIRDHIYQLVFFTNGTIPLKQNVSWNLHIISIIKIKNDYNFFNPYGSYYCHYQKLISFKSTRASRVYNEKLVFEIEFKNIDLKRITYIICTSFILFETKKKNNNNNKNICYYRNREKNNSSGSFLVGSVCSTTSRNTAETTLYRKSELLLENRKK